MEPKLKVSSGEIMSRLAKIQEEMEFVKEHLQDISMTEDDLSSLENAKRDLKEEKTRRL